MAKRVGQRIDVELHEVAVEVGVEPIPARKERGIRAIASGRKGHGELPAFAGRGIDDQQRVPAPMVEQPDENHVPAVAVRGGNGTPGVAAGGGGAVMAEIVGEYPG